MNNLTCISLAHVPAYIRGLQCPPSRLPLVISRNYVDVVTCQAGEAWMPPRSLDGFLSSEWAPAPAWTPAALTIRREGASAEVVQFRTKARATHASLTSL